MSKRFASFVLPVLSIVAPISYTLAGDSQDITATPANNESSFFGSGLFTKDSEILSLFGSFEAKGGTSSSFNFVDGAALRSKGTDASLCIRGALNNDDLLSLKFALSGAANMTSTEDGTVVKKPSLSLNELFLANTTTFPFGMLTTMVGKFCPSAVLPSADLVDLSSNASIGSLLSISNITDKGTVFVGGIFGISLPNTAVRSFDDLSSEFSSVIGVDVGMRDFVLLNSSFGVGVSVVAQKSMSGVNVAPILQGFVSTHVPVKDRVLDLDTRLAVLPLSTSKGNVSVLSGDSPMSRPFVFSISAAMQEMLPGLSGQIKYTFTAPVVHVVPKLKETIVASAADADDDDSVDVVLSKQVNEMSSLFNAFDRVGNKVAHVLETKVNFQVAESSSVFVKGSVMKDADFGFDVAAGVTFEF